MRRDRTFEVKLGEHGVRSLGGSQSARSLHSGPQPKRLRGVHGALHRVRVLNDGLRAVPASWTAAGGARPKKAPEWLRIPEVRQISAKAPTSADFQPGNQEYGTTKEGMTTYYWMPIVNTVPYSKY